MSAAARCDYEIKIADVDESGSMDFIVYGYMNRGDHEGAGGHSGLSL